MKIDTHLGDEAVLSELGSRLRALRLQSDLSQEELAQKSGLNRKVVVRIEAGEQTNTVSLIRLLRGLGVLSALNELLPEPGPTPLELFERQRGKSKQRASSKRSKQGHGPREWTWAE